MSKDLVCAKAGKILDPRQFREFVSGYFYTVDHTHPDCVLNHEQLSSGLVLGNFVLYDHHNGRFVDQLIERFDCKEVQTAIKYISDICKYTETLYGKPAITFLELTPGIELGSTYYGGFFGENCIKVSAEAFIANVLTGQSSTLPDLVYEIAGRNRFPIDQMPFLHREVEGKLLENPIYTAWGIFCRLLFEEEAGFAHKGEDHVPLPSKARVHNGIHDMVEGTLQPSEPGDWEDLLYHDPKRYDHIASLLIKAWENIPFGLRTNGKILSFLEEAANIREAFGEPASDKNQDLAFFRLTMLRAWGIDVKDYLPKANIFQNDMEFCLKYFFRNDGKFMLRPEDASVLCPGLFSVTKYHGPVISPAPPTPSTTTTPPITTISNPGISERLTGEVVSGFAVGATLAATREMIGRKAANMAAIAGIGIGLVTRGLQSLVKPAIQYSTTRLIDAVTDLGTFPNACRRPCRRAAPHAVAVGVGTAYNMAHGDTPLTALTSAAATHVGLTAGDQLVTSLFKCRRVNEFTGAAASSQYPTETPDPAQSRTANEAGTGPYRSPRGRPPESPEERYGSPGHLKTR